jgi:hypothetical protein
MLFPRGTRLRTLPSMFRDAEYFIMTLWGHDAIQITANNALALVNDSLLATPVLLQVASTTAAEPRTIDLPFPPPLPEQLVPDDTTSLVPEQLALCQSGIVQTIVDTLAIRHQFGFIRLVQVDDEWVLQEVVFGLPLFDHAMSRYVCQRISADAMFSPDYLDRQSRENRMLSLSVLDFVAEHLGKPMQLEYQQLPAPGRVLSFDGTRLV